MKAATLAINVTARTKFNKLISTSIRMLLPRNADNRGF